MLLKHRFSQYAAYFCVIMGIFQVSLRGLKSSCSLIADIEKGISGVFFGFVFFYFKIVLVGHLIHDFFFLMKNCSLIRKLQRKFILRESKFLMQNVEPLI